MKIEDLTPTQRAAIRAGLNIIRDHAFHDYEEESVLADASENKTILPIGYDEVIELTKAFA